MVRNKAATSETMLSVPKKLSIFMLLVSITGKYLFYAAKMLLLCSVYLI
jgi:hypothetical protein